jgi:hypothetical protein
MKKPYPLARVGLFCTLLYPKATSRHHKRPYVWHAQPLGEPIRFAGVAGGLADTLHCHCHAFGRRLITLAESFLLG